ncbi:tyrosine--tRNA ligase 1, cytoplasmic isoform X4 [Aegilops tauschii subsp. strangulata]
MLFQKVDIWLLDMDQREVSILARKYCEDIKRENGPIILLNHMLPDLLEYPEIAEKLDHARAISMEDTEDDVNLKVMVRAFCPPQAVKHNPCLEYIKYLILPWFGEFEVVQERNGLHGIFTNMEMLIADYKHGALRAPDMKLALEKAINKILQSVHEHFRNNAYAKIYGKPTSVLLYPKTSCSIAWCLSICRSVRIFHSEQERMFLIMFIHNTIYGSA